MPDFECMYEEEAEDRRGLMAVQSSEILRAGFSWDDTSGRGEDGVGVLILLVEGEANCVPTGECQQK